MNEYEQYPEDATQTNIPLSEAPPSGAVETARERGLNDMVKIQSYWDYFDRYWDCNMIHS